MNLDERFSLIRINKRNEIARPRLKKLVRTTDGWMHRQAVCLTKATTDVVLIVMLIRRAVQ